MTIIYFVRRYLKQIKKKKQLALAVMSPAMAA
jgi:hypothetical protein